MRPSHPEPFGSYNTERELRRGSQDVTMMGSNTRRIRTEDSWIEISSRPSSSSLSSSTHELMPQINTTTPNQPRMDLPSPAGRPRSASIAGSSQDEYEESESESDRGMAFSNEEIYKEDDDRTALGVSPTDKAFVPQPNAFSHPPAQRSAPNSYFPTLSSDPVPVTQPDGFPRHYRQRATGSFQPDHDAALRASLTTLLSCAAAVRPKSEDKSPDKTPERIVTRRLSTQPTSLRLVPESALETTRPAKPIKRKSRESSKERNAKKTRAVKSTVATEEVVSSTVASWMISAGLVLVLSAISFSAGYAWGREVGRIEGEMGTASGSCGREALRGSGLKRLRWSMGNSSVRA